MITIKVKTIPRTPDIDIELLAWGNPLLFAKTDSTGTYTWENLVLSSYPVVLSARSPEWNVESGQQSVPDGADVTFSLYEPAPGPQFYEFNVFDLSTQLPIEGALCKLTIGNDPMSQGPSGTTNTAGYTSIQDPTNVGWVHISKEGYETRSIEATGYQINTFLTAVGPIQLSYTISASIGGTTIPAPGAYTDLYQATISVTTEPEDGYYLLNWLINNVLLSPVDTFQFQLVRIMTIHAIFKSFTEPPNGNGNGNGNGAEPSGCFILTALGDGQLVADARAWRNDRPWFISTIYRLYYVVSPPIARALALSYRIREAVKRPIELFIRLFTG